METKIIRKFEEFEKIRDEWNESLKQSRSNVFFLTFEWLSVWWKCFGRGHELFLIVILNEDKIAAAAPLMIKNIRLWNITITRKLQFIGSGNSDYMDFLIPAESDTEVFSLIFDKIKENSGLWDYAEFKNVPECPNNVPAWYSYRNPYWIKTERNRGAVSVVIDISKYDSWEMFFNNLNKKFRNDLKRQENNLSKKGELSFCIYKNHENIRGILEIFFNWHCQRSLYKGFRSQFNDEKARSLYSELSDSDMVEVSCIRLGEEILALHFGFVYNDCYYYYTPVFNPKFERFSPGKVLLSKLIGSSFTRGMKSFDLLLGEEKYKSFWASSKVNLRAVSYFQKTAGSLLAFFYEKLKTC